MLISEDSANVANWVCATVSGMKIPKTVTERGTRCSVDASLLDDFGLRHVSCVLLDCPTASVTMQLHVTDVLTKTGMGFPRRRRSECAVGPNATGLQRDRIVGATPEMVCR
jgi:hypothetical protein